MIKYKLFSRCVCKIYVTFGLFIWPHTNNTHNYLFKNACLIICFPTFILFSVCPNHMHKCVSTHNNYYLCNYRKLETTQDGV